MKLVVPDSLNDSQSEQLARYARFFPAGGVCVNVMLGREPWDIRPLVLSGGAVTLMRFSIQLEEPQAKTLAAELEGFSIVCAPEQRVRYVPEEARVLISRPFVSHTLKDQLEAVTISDSDDLLQIVRSLIKIIATLARRNMSHGHLSLSNIWRQNGEVRLLDPMLGALNATHDVYLPPEATAGSTPEHAGDLYSLGRIIRIVLGDTLTSRQAAVVDQLLLPSPRQRPPLVEVAVAFGAQASALADGPVEVGATKEGAGRLVRTTKSSGEQGTSRATRSTTPTTIPPHYRRLLISLVALTGILVGTGVIMRYRYPATFFALARYVPLLAPQYSAEYEADWASGERARMLIVARAAVIARDPAAVNAIIDDVLAGSNPSGVIAPLLRVALNSMWRASLRDDDSHAALSLALAPLFPQAAQGIPQLSSLHPGVLLAIASQTRPLHANEELKALPLQSLSSLPEPMGPGFSELAALGVTSLGDPRALAFAAIMTGGGSLSTFDIFMTHGGADDPQQAFQRLALLEPYITARKESAEELLAMLRDQASILAPLVSWFDIEDFAEWESVPASSKVKLILGQLPAGLTPQQLFDLLLFPNKAVREQIVAKLHEKMFTRSQTQLLQTIASADSGITREQVIVLLGALIGKPQEQHALIAAWFDLKPLPDTVLLILLARGGADTSDRFNLEAARYLRRTDWQASLDVLRLLASHPEPLARVLAYTRLNPAQDSEARILRDRLEVESDEGCRKALIAKLSGR